MKGKSDAKIQHGCCYPKNETTPTDHTTALSMLGQHSSTSSTLHSTLHGPLLILGNEERKAVEAHKLQVEMWRSMAIEYTRRNTIR